MTLMRQKISISREDLYNQVWTTPMLRLAQKYGVSDVGLAKACKRHNIPRPPRGYWTKKVCGKSVSKESLPICQDPQLQNIRIERAGACATVIDDESSFNLPIRVPDKLRSPHQLVANTKEILEDAEPDFAGFVTSNSAPASLNVKVSRKSAGRAMRLLDTIIKQWEEFGGTTRSSALGMNNDYVSISISEIAKPKETQSSTNSWQRPRRYPTGKLVLSVSGNVGNRLRCNWSDGRRQRLEDLIPSFLNGVIRQIEDLRHRRIDLECLRRQRQKAMAVRQRVKQLAEEESERREELLTMVGDYQKAQQIRGFLGVLEEKTTQSDIPLEAAESYERWLKWAHWFADSFDPTTPSSPCPVAHRPNEPRNISIDEIDLTKSTRAILTRLGIANSVELYQLSEERIKRLRNEDSWGIWDEICCVLEGLDFDVSERQYWI